MKICRRRRRVPPMGAALGRARAISPFELWRRLSESPTSASNGRLSQPKEEPQTLYTQNECEGE